jgi:hypothetical protein
VPLRHIPSAPVMPARPWRLINRLPPCVISVHPQSGGQIFFELVDDSIPNAVPKAIYRLDLNNQMFAYPQNNSTIHQELISNQSVTFGRLTASKVPGGVILEIDVT